MKSNKSKAALFALLLFGFGATVGALGHRYYTATVMAKTAEDFRQKYVSEMQSKLNLNQHQVDQLQIILDDTKARFRALRETRHSEMEKIKEDQVAKVRAILSPDQTKQYAVLVTEHEQHAKEQDDRDRHQEQHQHDVHLKALAGH